MPEARRKAADISSSFLRSLFSHGGFLFLALKMRITQLSIEVAGQDESVDLARPAPLCLKFVSGGWDYFNNGGSLINPAPQFVSGPL
jgi:hypothetical protein